MAPLRLAFALGVASIGNAYALPSTYLGDLNGGTQSFNTAVAAAGGNASHDTWLNPQWTPNSGQYSGTSQMPFVFNGLERSGYSVEKGLFPIGIPARLAFPPVQEPGVDYGPLTYFSSLSGQAVNFNPDTQAAGGPNIYGGYHPGIEYGLTFKFDHPINAFGLEYQVEAHNGNPEPARASFYFSLDDGPGQLVVGPVTPDSTDRASFVGILDAAKSFSTITFYTDGPRGNDGELLAFYNAYAGGTISYASLAPVPEVPATWMLSAGLGWLVWRSRRRTS